MLLTGKKACYVLDTVDETYLMFSRHYNENIQKVASLEDITDEIFKFTTNFTEETSRSWRGLGQRKCSWCESHDNRF